MAWLALAGVVLGAVILAAFGRASRRRVNLRSDDDRREALRSFDGQHVTVVVGYYPGIWRTISGTLLSDRWVIADPRPSLWSVTVGSGRRKWFHVSAVREIRDPKTGGLIGGPW